jgi:hypothetical protein
MESHLDDTPSSGQEVFERHDATARMQERAEFPRAAGARSLLRECKRRKVASSQQKADNVSLTGFVAGRGGVKLRPVELSPLADGAIDSGIELEQSDHQFLHHGLHLDAGTWRVLQVRKGSCCVRQGTCGPGDIIVSLNGVPIAGVGDHQQVASLLRGRAGSAISIEVIHSDCRHAMARQRILAPSPADFGISAQSSGSPASR